VLRGQEKGGLSEASALKLRDVLTQIAQRFCKEQQENIWTSKKISILAPENYGTARFD
jgi:hypothetical protein